MRIAAKGTVDPNYYAFGRAWPKNHQVEIEVTADEYEAIKKDSRIVCIAIPDAPALSPVSEIHSGRKGK